MRRSTIALLAGLCILVSALSALAETEVKMTGDTRIFGEYMSMRNFNGWDQTGMAKENKF